MRTISLSNTVINFPDKMSWLYDNTYIVLKGNDVSVGADIRVTNTSTGEYRKLKHISEIERIVFPLNDTLFSLYSDSYLYNITLNLYENGTQVASFGFDTDIYNGRSLPLRAHGSTRTVYVYGPEDLYKLQMLYPTSGNLSVNGSTVPILSSGIIGKDLRPYITNTGIYKVCFNSGAKPGSDQISIVNVKNITPFSAVAELDFSKGDGQIPAIDEQKGDIWADSKFKAQSYCFDIIYEEVCKNFNAFKVRYTDTDGCLRYLAGRIMEDTTNASGENYYRLDTTTVLKNISRKYITGSSGVVKVAYPNLRKDSYWNDILLSPKIEFLNYNNEWVECSVVDESVTVTAEESEDVTLQFQLFVN